MKHLSLLMSVRAFLMIQTFLSWQHLQVLTEARSINMQHNQNHQESGNKKRIEDKFPQQHKSSEGYDGDDILKGRQVANESFQKSHALERLTKTYKPRTMTTEMEDSRENIEVSTADIQSREDIDTYDLTELNTQKTNSEHIVDTTSSDGLWLNDELQTSTEDIDSDGDESQRPILGKNYTNTLPKAHHLTATNETIAPDTIMENTYIIAPQELARDYQSHSPSPMNLQNILEVLNALQSNLSSTTTRSSYDEVAGDFNDKSKQVKNYYKLDKKTTDNSQNKLKMKFDIPAVPSLNFNLKIEHKADNDSNATFHNITRYSRHRNSKHKSKKHGSKFGKHHGSLYNTVQKRRSHRSISEDSNSNGASFSKSKSYFKNASLKHKNLRKHHPTDPTHGMSTEKDTMTKVTKTNTSPIIKITRKTSKNNRTEDAQSLLSANKSLRSKSDEFSTAHTNLFTMNNNLGSTSQTDRKRVNETKASNFVHKLPVQDSQKLFKLMYLNASNDSQNDSQIEGGERKIYMIKFPASDNGSFPNDTEIVKMLKSSQLLDNVHYIEARDIVKGKKTEKCCQDFLTVIKQNPFAFALGLAVCCVVIVLMVISVFFIAERRFKYRQPPSSSKKDPPEYKILKNREQKAKSGQRNKERSSSGQVNKGANRPTVSSSESEDSEDESNRFDNETDENNLRSKGRSSSEDESLKFYSETDEKNLRVKRNERGVNIRGTQAKRTDLETRAKKSQQESRKKEQGVMGRTARRLGRWVRRRISSVPISDSSPDDDNADDNASEESHLVGRKSSSDTDRTYTSKRQRLKRFVKTGGGRKKLPKKATTKLIAPDIRSTIKEVKMYLSEDVKSMESLPQSCKSLKRRIITTGDCQPIDNMLIRGDFEKAFYTAHGLDKIVDEETWQEHVPEERRKVDAEKIEASSISLGGLGVLSRGSSAVSLKSAVVRSINTAEWVNKDPRPVSNRRLKAKDQR